MCEHNHIVIRSPDGYFHHFFFGFFDGQRYQRFEVPDVCIINVYKHHAHNFTLEAFFYKKKHIYYRSNFRTKKDVYSAIQSLLEDFRLK